MTDRSAKYPPELRERAVPMAAETRGDHNSKWAAMGMSLPCERRRQRRGIDPTPKGWTGVSAGEWLAGLAVAVGFEPTNGLPRYTLSSSANPRSGAVVGVRPVLSRPVRGARRTRADVDE